MSNILIEKNLDTKDGKIFYWLSKEWKADGEILFFLHGMTGDHTMFDDQVKYFHKNYNILLWDAPAHGKSRPYQDFNYEKAAGVVKAIFDIEKIHDAVFIGQSMGGFLTQAVIKRYPEIVTAFVAIDSTPYGSGYYSKSDVFWLKQVEWMSYLFPLKTMKKVMAKQNTVTTAGYENMISMLEPYGKKELCHLMGIGYAGFLEDNCKLDIACPVLLILGEKDNTGKVTTYNKQWKEKTGYRLVVVEDAAHNSNVDQPQKVNQVIEEFIQYIFREKKC